MPTSTYVPLANVTLTSTASTITFSSISQSYRDLVLVVSGYGTGGGNLAVRPNSDSSSSYPLVRMFGYSGGAGAGTGTETYFYCGGFSSSIFTQIKMDIFDYSATDKHKTTLASQDNAGDTAMRTSSRWPSTAAISSLTLSLTSNSFASGTTFMLYGIGA